MIPASIRFPAATILLAFGAYASNQFHTLFLEVHKGFDPDLLGTTVMVGSLTQMVLPFLVLHLGRILRKPDNIQRVAYLAMSLGLALLPSASGKVEAFLAYLLIILGLNASSSLSATMVLSATREHDRGWALWLRSMGTLGYAMMCLFSSWAAPRFGLENLYYVFSVFGVLAALSSWAGGNCIQVPATPQPFASVLRRLWEPETRQLLFIMALANCCIFGGVTFLGNFVHHELQGSDAMLAKAWTIATFSEIPLIWLSILVMRRYGLKWLILSGLICSSARLGITFLVHDHTLFFASQVLHGLFYGASLSGIGMFLAKRHGEEHLHSLQLVSQAFYSGFATAMGGKLAGLVWHHAGIRSVYLVAFVGAAIATIWLAWKFREPEPLQTPLITG